MIFETGQPVSLDWKNMKYTKKYLDLSAQIKEHQKAIDKIYPQIEKEARKFALICGEDGPVNYNGHKGCGKENPIGSMELTNVWKWNRGDDDWNIVGYEYTCTHCHGLNRLRKDFSRLGIHKDILCPSLLFAKIKDKYVESRMGV